MRLVWFLEELVVSMAPSASLVNIFTGSNRTIRLIGFITLLLKLLSVIFITVLIVFVFRHLRINIIWVK